MVLNLWVELPLAASILREATRHRGVSELPWLGILTGSPTFLHWGKEAEINQNTPCTILVPSQSLSTRADGLQEGRRMVRSTLAIPLHGPPTVEDHCSSLFDPIHDTPRGKEGVASFFMHLSGPSSCMRRNDTVSPTVPCNGELPCTEL